MNELARPLDDDHEPRRIMQSRRERGSTPGTLSGTVQGIMIFAGADYGQQNDAMIHMTPLSVGIWIDKRADGLLLMRKQFERFDMQRGENLGASQTVESESYRRWRKVMKAMLGDGGHIPLSFAEVVERYAANQPDKYVEYSAKIEKDVHRYCSQMLEYLVEENQPPMQFRQYLGRLGLDTA